ncbi:hypothetical protein DERP_014124 [Dermatophagoides pteronyssinus]|uniref:Uncharacterized protein n=1 Tax=Dermatophagoides pteronyssinus TaxID=6956 RepID=A0ABQ8IXD2_DERPT|nr:hypothetical protein DERP_014124 [Dermatophagoides pteronyssinus]
MNRILRQQKSTSNEVLDFAILNPFMSPIIIATAVSFHSLSLSIIICSKANNSDSVIMHILSLFYHY